MRTGDSVLVIGGTGFIGRILVEKLVNAGSTVRVLTRGRARQEGCVTYLNGEVADRESILRAVEGTQVVYDLSLGGGARWEDYVRDFIHGAENVAEACLRHGVRRMIWTSTIAALHLSACGSVDESAGPDPHPELRSWYSRGKILAEKSLLELHHTKKLPVVIVRPGIVVGRGNQLSHPGVGTWRSPTWLTVVGPGSTPLPFVLVEDVAEAMLLAKDAPGVDGHVFNLVGDVRPSAAEYVEICAERSQRNFHLLPQPIARIGAFGLAVWLGKALLRRKDNAFPSFYELKNSPQRTQLDCTAAKTLLGWRPVAERDEFVRRAIDIHLKPLPAGDLRLSA